VAKKKKEWTYKGYLFGALRRIFRWSPERRAALEAARQGLKYLCAKCGKLFDKRKIAVDHITPVVSPETGFVDWNTYIVRLFVTKDQLQVLCKPCHKEKTNLENTARRKAA
jgi:5-methylcytosine-specific restriction endonuclease McrA